MKPVICNLNNIPTMPECGDGVFVPVNSIQDVTPDRNHAYVDADDNVWIMSNDGTRMITINFPPT